MLTDPQLFILKRPECQPGLGQFLDQGIEFCFGGGLFLLMASALLAGECSITEARISLGSPAEIGVFLCGPLRDATILIGLTIAASLLAALILLQDDGEKG